MGPTDRITISLELYEAAGASRAVYLRVEVCGTGDNISPHDALANVQQSNSCCEWSWGGNVPATQAFLYFDLGGVMIAPKHSSSCQLLVNITQ